MSRFTHKPRRTTAPVRLIVVSFVLLIALGTLLLSLPVSSATGDFTNPVSALFTATSATCVTGLAVEDTTAHWSVFGQVVLLLLIQLGGLGLSTFATGFSLLVHRRLGIRQMVLTGEASGGDMPGAAGLLRLMLGFTFTCELLGAGLLALRFVPSYGARGPGPRCLWLFPPIATPGLTSWALCRETPALRPFPATPWFA